MPPSITNRDGQKRPETQGKTALGFNQAGKQSVKITAAPCKNFRVFRRFGSDRESLEGDHALIMALAAP